MHLTLPPIYPLTDVSISGFSHEEQVKALVDGGARIIQIRDKTASSAELYDAAKACLAITRRAGVRLIINDRVDIALAVDADGVHLGQTDLPAEAARRILGPDKMIGVSTHSLAQANAALKEPIDYLAFGPIFPTSTKDDPDDVVGLDALQLVGKAVGDVSLVAIGGISLENIASVLEAGADSAAVVSAAVAPGRSISERMRHLLAAASV